MRAPTIVDQLGRSRGQPAGSLLHIGERVLDRPRITLIEYDETTLAEREVKPEELAALRASDRVTWINVDGIHEPATIEALGHAFGLHPLLLEDVMSSTQRPKLEEYDDCLFVVLKMLSVDDKEERIIIEQVSVVLGKSFVITFQERVGDVFDEVRERIRTATGRIRKQQADYLAYRLLDAIVDNYFVALDAMSDLVESAETQMTDDPTKVDARELHTLKRETLFLRRVIWPARELIATLCKVEDPAVIRPTTLVYLRDVYDHILQVTETIEVLRGILASMTDVYHASISNRMNEVMKVMTIVSTIFIPLSFVAGVYGMNFEHMPELHTMWGYPAVLCLMLTAALGMVVYFRRKKWI